MFRCHIAFLVVVLPSILTQQIPENVRNITQVKLLPFLTLAHSLRSGTITILDFQTIFIEDLHYDGKGPDAHFWVGNGSWPSVNGTIVANEHNSTSSLNAYAGQNITIKLPPHLTVAQIDYLAVWCITHKHNFGHTYMRKKGSGGSPGVHLQPFSSETYGVRSGPIVAVNKKIFFIPNFYYDVEGIDATFWMGKGKEPSASGRVVFGEGGSLRFLPKYQGKSIYITLPYNTSTDDIDYFGIWCSKCNQSFGYTIIPKNAPIEPINGNHRFTADGKEIIRVKKCCPIGQVLEPNGCSSDNRKFNLTINVRERIDSRALKNLELVPFVQPILCKDKTYPLDPQEDNFLLLTNGSLALLTVLDPIKMYDMNDYCFETVNLKEDDKDRWVTTAFLCLNGANASMTSSAFVLYAVGILLSATFLIITALVFLFLKKIVDARDKCIVFYTSSMAVVFVCFIMAQFSKLTEDVCVIIAYLIQIFLVSSFTWLTLISTETLCKIIYYNSNAYIQDRNRLTVYLSVGILVPLLSFVITMIGDRAPDIPTIVLKQQFDQHNCKVAENQKTYFYMPIPIAIFCNTALGITMKAILMRRAHKYCRDIAWIALQDELKSMFRSCCLLLTLMALCWVSEIVSLFIGNGESIWLAVDIVNSLQGLIVFIIFVGHPSVSHKLCKRKKPLQSKYDSEQRPLSSYGNNT